MYLSTLTFLRGLFCAVSSIGRGMKFNRSRLVAPLLLTVSLVSATMPSSVFATETMMLDMDRGSGAVTFDAIGKPSALKIHAKGGAPKGQLMVKEGKVSGTLTFKLDSLDTGIGMRNDHMKKRYLETAKFPEAKLTLADLPLPEGYAVPDFSVSDLPFKATLSLHGIEKQVEGTLKAKRDGDDLAINARFALKIEDFSIKSPSFAGITMANDVNCAVEMKAPFKTL